MNSTERDPKANTWTLAYRNPRANHFKRLTDWSGTWAEAEKLAGVAKKAHPELEIWYTGTLVSERAGFVHPDDCGNILVPTGNGRKGRRVQVRETGSLAALGIAAPSDPTEADAVMSARNVVALPQGATAEELGAFMDALMAATPCDTCGAIGHHVAKMHDVAADFTAALVERCARLGHTHGQDHPYPAVEIPASASRCYAGNFAGLAVLAFDIDEWRLATVDHMLWRGDGFVVRFVDEPGSTIRATFGRIRLATAADGTSAVEAHPAALVEHVERQFAAGSDTATVVVGCTRITVTRDPDGAYVANRSRQRFTTVAGALGLNVPAAR